MINATIVQREVRWGFDRQESIVPDGHEENAAATDAGLDTFRTVLRLKLLKFVVLLVFPVLLLVLRSVQFVFE